MWLNTAPPDIPYSVNMCKDFMTAEWSAFKNKGDAEITPVCVYAMGGHKDLPASSLESIRNCFAELEQCLKNTLQSSVGRDAPIISSDVMVGADGNVTLYPERKFQTGAELAKEDPLPPPLGPGGRRQKKPPTPEEAFMTGAEQVSNYILDHLKRINEVCLLAGNIKLFYLILSSAVLIKSRISTYKSILKVPTSK